MGRVEEANSATQVLDTLLIKDIEADQAIGGGKQEEKVDDTLNAGKSAEQLASEQAATDEQKKLADAEAAKKTESQKDAEEKVRLQQQAGKTQEQLDAEKKAADEVTAKNSAPVISAELQTIFPDAKNPVEIVEGVVALREELTIERQATKVVNDLLEKTPQLVDLLTSLQKGENFHEALRAAFEISSEGVPDPKENPEAFTAHVEKQAQLKIAKEQKIKEQEQLKALREEAQKKLTANGTEFQKKKGLTNEQMTEFLQKVDKLTRRDQKTFMFPEDFLERMYYAVNYEKLNEQVSAEEKKKREGAELEARNKALADAEAKRKRGGDSLPDLTKNGSGGNGAGVLHELSDLENVVRTSSRVHGANYADSY